MEGGGYFIQPIGLVPGPFQRFPGDLGTRLRLTSGLTLFNARHARVSLMATQLLSRFERDYIVTGVNQDFREDGRSCRDYRNFSLLTGVVSNTSGSAKIQLVRR